MAALNVTRSPAPLRVPSQPDKRSALAYKNSLDGVMTCPVARRSRYWTSPMHAWAELVPKSS